jgi:hypothetical protein
MMCEAMQAILDLAEARLHDDRVTDPNVRHDLSEIARIASEAIQKDIQLGKDMDEAGL